MGRGLGRNSRCHDQVTKAALIDKVHVSARWLSASHCIQPHSDNEDKAVLPQDKAIKFRTPAVELNTIVQELIRYATPLGCSDITAEDSLCIVPRYKEVNPGSLSHNNADRHLYTYRTKPSTKSISLVHESHNYPNASTTLVTQRPCCLDRILASLLNRRFVDIHESAI